MSVRGAVGSRPAHPGRVIPSLLGVALALCSQGCGTCAPLSALPVEGGSAIQRELAHEALIRFEGWIGGEAICVPRVRFTTMKHGGRYNPVNRNIHLNVEVSEIYTLKDLTHELCHAADLQLGLHRDYVDVFDEGGERNQRELFAQDCSVGRTELQIATQLPCGLDSPRAEWLLDSVYDAEALELFGWELEASAKMPSTRSLLGHSMEGGTILNLRSDGHDLYFDRSSGATLPDAFYRLDAVEPSEPHYLHGMERFRKGRDPVS